MMLARTCGACLALGLLAAAAPAWTGEYRAPRNAYGAPDLNGLWSNSSLTEFERPKAFKTLVAPEAEALAWEAKHRGKSPDLPDDKVGGAQSEWWERTVGLARIRGQARTSWIVAPADGQFPWTAEAKAKLKLRRERTSAGVIDNPEELRPDERCLSSDAVGPPISNGGYNDNYEFLQAGVQLAIMSESMHDVRIIRIGRNERHPPLSFRAMLGDSIGRWEGETLVVETTNFAPLAISPYPVSPDADMKVIERFTRTGPSEITYEFLVSDPPLFSQSWRGEMVFHPTAGPIYEFACHEGNYAIVHMLEAARLSDGKAETAQAAR